MNDFTNNNNTNETSYMIPKEILNQYPYGDFPIQYTKLGQEKIRIQSEHRFENASNVNTQSTTSNYDMDSLLPLVQILTQKEKTPKDMMKIMSKIIFKDNPNAEKLFTLFTNNTKKQNIDNSTPFPDTHKYDIDKLKRVDE